MQLLGKSPVGAASAVQPAKYLDFQQWRFASLQDVSGSGSARIQPSF
ncbi:hypothetical protein [Mycobacterium sp. 1274756.6]|nr:hypothetical protein [Mycobacterium sp. 1274756.6]